MEENDGGIPRRETVFNKFLPYSDRLEEEAKLRLSTIKSNLSKCVLCKELKPGCYYWTNQLNTYITTYGRKFTKEDHIAFINLLFELVTIPKLEFFLLDNFARVLTTLLKKKELISRRDIILKWRPLYDVYQSVSPHNKFVKRALIRIPNTCLTSVQALIKACRIYFANDSTQEMLDEWRPLFCPYVRTEMNKAMLYFELFLPTELFPEEYDQSFKLWFDEFIQIWESCHNTPLWESSIVNLFSRLAKNTIGYIDWNPFIAMISTRLLRSFHLPVYVKQIRFQNTKEHYNLRTTSSLFVSMLGYNSSCQVYLNQLFWGLESFYHPSNSGIWNIRLQQLLAKLTDAFVQRIKQEKQPMKCWLPQIPTAYHLTEDDITSFVKCLKPCLLLSIFSKSGCLDASIALKNLAVLRPELIIPPILERFYPATETLTEPHRLLAIVQCLAYVVQPMVKGGKYLPDGPTHVLPILLSSLPGIDANDMHKTLATFQLISSIVILVPLIDCSQDVQNYSNLNKIELELCSASAQFEDFVLQFMDRCFNVIENASSDSSLLCENTKEGVSLEIIQLQHCMTSVFNLILNQSSPQIHEAAIDKLFNFVTNRILGIRDSGYLAAKLVQAATNKVDAKLTSTKMLPVICKIVDEMCLETNADSTNPDQGLLFNMLLLQELVCCDGRLLLPFHDCLLQVVTKISKLNSKEVHIITRQIIRNMLSSLTTTCFLEHQGTNPSDADDTIPVLNWGKPVERSLLHISWHTGNKEELEFAQELVDTFLLGEMEKLSDVMNGKISLNREELRQSVAMMNAVLLGCLSHCPLWEESSIPIMESCTNLEVPSDVIHTKDAGVISLRGENLRAKLAHWLQDLNGYLLKNHEDNIAVFRIVIKIYHQLLFYWGCQESYQKQWKFYTIIKKILDNPLRRKTHQYRYLLIHRVYLQHQMRVASQASNHFSILHQSMMCDLLNHAINHYSEIRILAQWVLGECYIHLPFSYHRVLPQLEELIGNCASYTHDQLKGMLHVILGQQHHYSLLTRRDWDVACKLWPVVVKTPISDRPSVNMLLDALVSQLSKVFETFAIFEEIPHSVLDAASAVLAMSSEYPSGFIYPTETEINDKLVIRNQKMECNSRNYTFLVTQHITLLRTPNLHWQSFQLGIELLTILIRHDVVLPVEAVQLILQSLLNDTISVRFWAMHGLQRVLQQHRPNCIYIEVDPKNVSLINGMCDHSTVPTTATTWDQTLFVDQPHLGFYCWPKIIRIHASAGEQVNRFKNRTNMSEIEGSIYDFFMSSSNIDKLVMFMSAEINKDLDKLETYKCDVIKGLFRNYGDAFLDLFSTHIESFIHGALDSQKRCGLEIVTGIIAGSKHWGFYKLQKLWKFLSPVIRHALNGVTIDLQSDWIRAIKYMVGSSDPRRIAWLMELLLENLLTSKEGSFVEANRLYLLFTFLSEHEWKTPDTLKHVLEMVQPHLAHPYQNIRDELGRLLGLVLLTNSDVAPFKHYQLGPSQTGFVESILPRLEVFKNAMTATLSSGSEDSLAISEENIDWKTSVALLKTVCRWLRRRLVKTLQLMSSDIIQLLPYLCLGETCDRDPELQNSCRLAIAIMGQAYIPHELTPIVVETVVQLSLSSSWRARKTALEYLQVLVFSNLFTFMEYEICIHNVIKVVLNLLEDSRPEVQQMAAITLSGMFHCNILKADEPLLNNFLRLSKTPVVKDGTVNGESVRRRHAGILGMTAYIRAHPYDICDRMPDLLVALGRHLHDPQPLQTTVRQALTNFWRTHHDNWADHKAKFTDDQLADITDLLVSPNYYA